MVYWDKSHKRREIYLNLNFLTLRLHSFQMDCMKQKLISGVNRALLLVTSQHACMHSNTHRNVVTKIKCKHSSTGICSYATLISVHPLKVRALVTTKNKSLLISEQLSQNLQSFWYINTYQELSYSHRWRLPLHEYFTRLIFKHIKWNMENSILNRTSLVHKREAK